MRQSKVRVVGKFSENKKEVRDMLDRLHAAGPYVWAALLCWKRLLECGVDRDYYFGQCKV